MIIKQETELIGKDILKMVISVDETTEKFFNIFLNLLNRYVEALCNDYNTECKESVKIIKVYDYNEKEEYKKLLLNIFNNTILSEKNKLEAINLVIKIYKWDVDNNNNASHRYYISYYKMLKMVALELLREGGEQIGINHSPDLLIQNIITIKRLARYWITNDENFILPQLQIPLVRQVIENYLKNELKILQIYQYDSKKNCVKRINYDYKRMYLKFKKDFSDIDYQLINKIYNWSCRFIHAGYKESRWFIELCTECLKWLYCESNRNFNYNCIQIFNIINQNEFKKRKLVVSFKYKFDFELYTYVNRNKKMKQHINILYNDFITFLSGLKFDNISVDDIKRIDTYHFAMNNLLNYLYRIICLKKTKWKLYKDRINILDEKICEIGQLLKNSNCDEEILKQKFNEVFSINELIQV